MHVEFNKKDRRIEIIFGTAKTERELFDFLKKQLSNLMKSINNFHTVKFKVREELEMKNYAIKKET